MENSKAAWGVLIEWEPLVVCYVAVLLLSWCINSPWKNRAWENACGGPESKRGSQTFAELSSWRACDWYDRAKRQAHEPGDCLITVCVSQLPRWGRSNGVCVRYCKGSWGKDDCGRQRSSLCRPDRLQKLSVTSEKLAPCRAAGLSLLCFHSYLLKKFPQAQIRLKEQIVVVAWMVVNWSVRVCVCACVCMKDEQDWISVTESWRYHQFLFSVFMGTHMHFQKAQWLRVLWISRSYSIWVTHINLHRFSLG